jgi:hypothetical protein
MSTRPAPTTAICHATTDAIHIRGASLVDELIGQVSFTEMMLFQLLGQRPRRAQVAVLDAVLVTLMEHGLTPSAIATRLIYDSAPEALQSAVAAGLLGVGSTFGLGTGYEAPGQLGGADALTISDARLMGIGQGPVTWTPMHAANTYATIARGVAPPIRSRILSSKTASEILPVPCRSTWIDWGLATPKA